MERVPHGIVERVNNGYVGYCYEVGTSAQGTTVEEAFANLNTATWQALQEKGISAATFANTPYPNPPDDVKFCVPSETDTSSIALGAMTTVLLDGLGDFEPLSGQQSTQ